MRAALRVEHAPPAAALRKDCGAEQTQPAKVREHARVRTECASRARAPSAARNCSPNFIAAVNSRARVLLLLIPPSRCYAGCSHGVTGHLWHAAPQLAVAVGALQERQGADLLINFAFPTGGHAHGGHSQAHSLRGHCAGLRAAGTFAGRLCAGRVPPATSDPWRERSSVPAGPLPGDEHARRTRHTSKAVPHAAPWSDAAASTWWRAGRRTNMCAKRSRRRTTALGRAAREDLQTIRDTRAARHRRRCCRASSGALARCAELASQSPCAPLRAARARLTRAQRRCTGGCKRRCSRVVCYLAGYRANCHTRPRRLRRWHAVVPWSRRECGAHVAAMRCTLCACERWQQPCLPRRTAALRTSRRPLSWHPDVSAAHMQDLQCRRTS